MMVFGDVENIACRGQGQIPSGDEEFLAIEIAKWRRKLLGYSVHYIPVSL